MAVDLDLKLVEGATPTFAKVKKVVVSLVRGLKILSKNSLYFIMIM